jgi:4-hydroxy-tetrahydrodipicolinate reductase
MKIAIIGYGQMGKLIEKLAPDFGLEVVCVIDPILNTEITEKNIIDADVCIDFSLPNSILSNTKKIAKLRKNLVIGTTGWQEHFYEIEQLSKNHEIGIIYASNFSIGMNTFFLIVENAAKLMNQLPQYDAFGYEMHHNKKQDSPSGTAKTLADIIIANLDKKTSQQFEKLDRKIAPEEFHFASIRSGNIPGTHTIGFDSMADTIELKHTARNREGFAQGAIQAAKWINGKTGIYNFQEIFYEILMDKI